MPHLAVWFSEGKEYRRNLLADLRLRKMLGKRLANAMVGRVVIERLSKSAVVTIYSARPGLLIGRKGSDIGKLTKEVSDCLGLPTHVKIEEIYSQDTDASLIAQNIARQLEKRVMYRRAMKRAVQLAKENGTLGIKVEVSGRLGGAEIARKASYREGRVPLHTLRAYVDFALAEARTSYGVIGVKVWIFHKEILDNQKISFSENREPRRYRGRRRPAPSRPPGLRM